MQNSASQSMSCKTYTALLVGWEKPAENKNILNMTIITLGRCLPWQALKTLTEVYRGTDWVTQKSL